MKTKESVLEDLRKLIGKEEWSADDIIEGIGDFENPRGEDYIFLEKSNNFNAEVDYIAFVECGETIFHIQIERIHKNKYSPEYGEKIIDIWDE